MVSQLGKLQRKVRFQQWKYGLAALVVSLAGIAVSVFNTTTAESQTVLITSQTPVTTPSASTSSIDFFHILSTLDEKRKEAFEKRDLDALMLVNEKNSPQELLDRRLLKRIINRKLAISFKKSTLLSVSPLSRVEQDSVEVMLKVKDSVDGVERLWNITLKKQVDGSWRISLVTKVPL